MPPAFATRAGGLAGAAALVLVSAMPAAATSPPALRIEYNAAIYGDFTMAGNSVTTCPPVIMCRQAMQRKAFGPLAQNNSHAMRWVDVDGDARTYNSASGRLHIPTGARVVFAKLTWAGNTGSCGTIPPPGPPREQAVSVTINQAKGTLRPELYTVDDTFYSGKADLTERLRGVTGEVTITVGNVWTPQGFDCFGGWSALAVWAFDRPPAPALARKQITVYDLNLRMHAGIFGANTRAHAIRPAGGITRLGVTAFEGDWALSGDRLRVNGHDQDRTGNFFPSAAEGALNPNNPNNMSVDVRTIIAPPGVIKAGVNSVELAFSSGLDAYIVRTMAISTTMPELVAEITPQRQAVHEKDEIRHTIRVANPGGAPAAKLRVRFPGCDKEIPRLDGGQSNTLTCTTTVSGETSRVEVSGESLIGDRLTAHAESTVEVLRPAITASMAAMPRTVLKGETPDYEISIHNTGNTPLTAVTADCATAGTLSPGLSKTVRCPAKGKNPITVSGVDKLGKRVSTTASAEFTEADPKVTITATPSTRAVREGESVRITVTVANPSTVPLAGVTIDGTPEQCARTLGALGPGKSITYTCEVMLHGRLSTAPHRARHAGPRRPHGPRHHRREPTGNCVSRATNPLPLPPPLTPTAKTGELPQEPAPVAALIAGLAVLSNFVTTGAIAATACRKR